ncbi:Uncharacterised protein [Mycobacteroides abscessus subsp. abscessus]|nr:Uncharacterised protein [Mycobacteroides abscessus subsp. abscessus]
MDIVGPAVQQDYRWPVGRPLVDIADIEQPGIDLFEGRKLGARACRVDTGTIRARPECGGTDRGEQRHLGKPASADHVRNRFCE